MVISFIVAAARNKVIGRDNAMPWHLPADLKYFKRITLGKPVIMGRKTFEAIGRPLPGRANIIVTHDAGYVAADCRVVHSIEEALRAVEGAGETMVIGGAKLFEQLLPRAGRIYLTEVHDDFAGDAWFPEMDPNQWRETGRIDCPPDEANPHAYSFVVLERRG